MNFKFNCPQCGNPIEADDSFRGEVVACPHCDKGIVVPRGKPKLGIARHSEVGGNTRPSPQHPPQHSRSVPPPQERVAMPERFADPTQDPVVMPSETSARRWPKIILKILLPLLVGVGIVGAASYGAYLYFGDKPRLERGITCYEKKVYAKALQLLLPLAKKGCAKAQLYVGDCYANGNGVIMDTEEAVKWYNAAADQELADAQHRMYKCCLDGIGTERNLENAAKWCRKAADAGFVEAMFDMGALYDEGLGVEQNAKSVVKWYRRGAEQGYPPCLYQLGLCYKLGYGVEKDEDEASKWQNKAVSAWRASANAGDTEAMIRLGDLYMKGDLVELDKEKAVQWYRKAAEAGNAYGQARLALCYHNGDGVGEDNEEAAKWMLKSAEQGVDCGSQWNMCVFYHDGIGVAKDIKESVKWMERSAKKGFPKAKYNLALCYFRGEGVEVDVVKAEKLLAEAADAGDEEAKTELDRIKNERKEEARILAQEKAEKEKEIAKLSDIENTIEEFKERVNNILKGRQKGDWYGFDASKITMTDASVNITEEQPLKHLAGNLSEKDTMKKIREHVLDAQKEVARLQDRIKGFARVKKLYDEKELESRKETCAPCSGTGMVSCTKCKGAGEVISRESLPCPTCCDDTYGKQSGEGKIAKEVVCGYCRGRGDVTVKCRRCNGSGKVRGSDRDMSGKFVLDNRVECPVCYGDKKITQTCPRCSGDRRVVVRTKCQTCNGSGKVVQSKKMTCPVCKGEGKFTCERCSGHGFTYRPKAGVRDVNHDNSAYNAQASNKATHQKSSMNASSFEEIKRWFEDGDKYGKKQMDILAKMYADLKKDKNWKDKSDEEIRMEAKRRRRKNFVENMSAEDLRNRFKYDENGVVTEDDKVIDRRINDYFSKIGMEREFKQEFKPKQIEGFLAFRNAEENQGLSAADITVQFASDTGLKRKEVRTLWAEAVGLDNLSEGEREEVIVRQREVEQWIQDAEGGDVNAQYELGLRYINGDEVDEDVEEAIRWFRKAAMQGHINAQYELGRRYNEGDDVEMDYREAARWFRMAAEKGDADSQYELGLLCSEDNGKEAVRWLRAAAMQGHAEAQYELGWRYAEGEDLKKDNEEAVRWFREAAAQGHEAAQKELRKLKK